MTNKKAAGFPAKESCLFYFQMRSKFLFFPSIEKCLLAHNSGEEAISMKKIWMLLALLTLSAALLTGCASNADTLATPTPGATQMIPQVSPNATDGMMNDLMPDLMPSLVPGASAAPLSGAGGITTLEDARRASENMEDALEKLSEVDDAYVVAAGNTALVGLEFNAQYQGQVDDRLKKMVLTRVQTVDKTITGVAVTADPSLVRQIEALEETLDDATSLSAVATQAEELTGQIQVYRE